MSYDVSLTCDKCQFVMCDLNMTSNVAPMWRDAGIDLQDEKYQGKPASVLLPDLQAAIDAMIDDPAHYRRMNPINGWGSYETALDFLRDLRNSACRNPDAVCEVSH